MSFPPSASGRVEVEWCLDSARNAVVREDGCFVRRFEHGDGGDVSSTACLQDDLTPIVNAEGVHRTRYLRDERGQIIEESYYDAGGNRVSRFSDGCARIKMARDPAGSVIEVGCQDASGMPQRFAGQTHGTVRTKVDENGCPTERSYLDAHTGEEESGRVLLRTDPYCNELRHDRRDRNGTLIGVAWDLKLDAEGRQIEKRCETKIGPAQCPQFGYYSDGPRGAVHRWEYDAHGRVESQRCFQPDGTPSTCDNQYPHGVRFEYDEGGRLIAEVYFDPSGQPAAWLGVTREERNYNAPGRLIALRYRNRASELINSRCGNAGQTIVYDARQRQVTIEFTDKTGNAVAPYCHVVLDYVEWPPGAASVKVVRQPGKPMLNEFYSAKGSLIKTVDFGEPGEG